MRKIQVLIATMHQKDDTIAQKMNLRCDVVIANQADSCCVTERAAEGGTVKMITTDTRGVGVNRNIALMEADARILLFADDDMVYYDGTLKGVLEAFERNPDADLIFFGVDILKEGKITERRRNKPGRLPLCRALRYGTYAMAVRADAIRRANICFSRLFGGGALYGSGEDTLFIRECFRKGLRVYASEYTLGTCCKDTSSWFRGYDEKFFYDKGALYACAFPHSKYLVMLYFALKFAKKGSVSVLSAYRTMCEGCRGFAAGRAYGTDAPNGAEDSHGE